MATVAKMFVIFDVVGYVRLVHRIIQICKKMKTSCNITPQFEERALASKEPDVGKGRGMDERYVNEIKNCRLLIVF